jgi:hypothetical protein
MLVEVINVEREEKPSSNGKGTYGSLTVAYKSNGKIAEKKLMSFVNPNVFKHFEKAQKGDQVEVTSVKNEKTGYWDWTAIGAPSTASPGASSSPSSQATKVVGSNYETKEERAVKQRYIVRQSSVSAAISALSIGAKGALKSGEIIELAKQFEEYVFSTSEAKLDLSVDLTDIEDDIVF